MPLATRPMISEVRHVGGAFARPAAHGGALTSLDGGYLLSTIGLVHDPAAMDAASRATRAVIEALAPWHCDGMALTFTEDGRDLAPAFGPNAARLSALKRELDPDAVLAPAHCVA